MGVLRTWLLFGRSPAFRMFLSAASEKPKKVNRSIALHTLVRTMCSPKLAACLYVSPSTQTISQRGTDCKYVRHCKSGCVCVHIILRCILIQWDQNWLLFQHQSERDRLHRLHNVTDISSSSWRGFWWLQWCQKCCTARKLWKSFGLSGEGFVAYEGEKKNNQCFWYPACCKLTACKSFNKTSCLALTVIDNVICNITPFYQ